MPRRCCGGTTPRRAGAADDLIPLAEESGLGHAVGLGARACLGRRREWRRQGPGDHHVREPVGKPAARHLDDRRPEGDPRADRLRAHLASVRDHRDQHGARRGERGHRAPRRAPWACGSRSTTSVTGSPALAPAALPWTCAEDRHDSWPTSMRRPAARRIRGRAASSARGSARARLGPRVSPRAWRRSHSSISSRRKAQRGAGLPGCPPLSGSSWRAGLQARAKPARRKPVAHAARGARRDRRRRYQLIETARRRAAESEMRASPPCPLGDASSRASPRPRRPTPSRAALGTRERSNIRRVLRRHAGAVVIHVITVRAPLFHRDRDFE